MMAVREVAEVAIVYLSWKVHAGYPVVIPQVDVWVDALFLDASGQVPAAPPPRSTNSHTLAMTSEVVAAEEEERATKVHAREA